jgi:RHS repeat-associated protein
MTQSLRYMHGDDLGSAKAFTDENGELVHVQHFDPWGKAEDGAEGSGDANVKNIRTGFTGHESDAETGLVNMRGRLYDPRIGRFMQADPIIQLPMWSQGWNRYSYALNNPLAYTDPSGFAPDEIDEEFVYGDDCGDCGDADFADDVVRSDSDGVEDSSTDDEDDGGGESLGWDEVDDDDSNGEMTHDDDPVQRHGETALLFAPLSPHTAPRLVPPPAPTPVPPPVPTAPTVPLWRLAPWYLFITIMLTPSNDDEPLMSEEGGVLRPLGEPGPEAQDGGGGKKGPPRPPNDPSLDDEADGPGKRGQQRGVGGRGWRGDRAWRKAAKEVDKGGTIRSIDGVVPTKEEALRLINDAKGTVQRIEGPHLTPNPHNFNHINFTTRGGSKGTIQISDL